MKDGRRTTRGSSSSARRGGGPQQQACLHLNIRTHMHVHSCALTRTRIFARRVQSRQKPPQSEKQALRRFARCRLPTGSRARYNARAAVVRVNQQQPCGTCGRHVSSDCTSRKTSRKPTDLKAHACNSDHLAQRFAEIWYPWSGLVLARVFSDWRKRDRGLMQFTIDMSFETAAVLKSKTRYDISYFYSRRSLYLLRSYK